MNKFTSITFLRKEKKIFKKLAKVKVKVDLIVGNVFAKDFVSLRQQVYARYMNYFQGLFRSSSKEVRHLVRIISRDVRSVTSKNVELIARASGLSPWDFSKLIIQKKFCKTPVPDNDEWRSGLLSKLLEMRRNSMEKKHFDELIESLCTT